ncbi:hypothetical protein ACFLZE_02210 [Thermodesulfobacteriota bacterium]
MKKSRSPVHAKGYRNVFCPHYRNCLDHASKKYWNYWTCADCQYKCDQESVADVLASRESTNPYYSISPAINGKLKNVSI